MTKSSTLPPTDLAHLIAEWLERMAVERGAADLTIEAYARDLRAFTGWLAGHLGHAPTLADAGALDLRAFRGFMAARRREGLEGRSLARTMSALRTFYRYLETEEVVANRAIFSAVMPKVGRGVPKPLTREKAAALVADTMAAQLDPRGPPKRHPRRS